MVRIYVVKVPRGLPVASSLCEKNVQKVLVW